jgi:hypothetical protein
MILAMTILIIFYRLVALKFLIVFATFELLFTQ